MIETQHDRILGMLRQGPVCGSEFLSVYLPTYSQRIGELKKKGYGIERVKCAKDWHNHQSGIATYVLVSDLDAVREHFEREPDPESYDAGNYDEVYADMKERANDEPDPEPPSDDVEDTFHTSVVWPDDEADHGHDSAVDQAAGEGLLDTEVETQGLTDQERFGE